MDAVKTAWSETTARIGGVRFVFIKSPDLKKLSYWFKKMLHESVFMFFSDDACCSLKTGTGMLFFNLDISACDSSNGPAVFEALRELVPHSELAHLESLIRQCQADLRVGYGSEKLLFRPVDYFEYSGSVLTTTLNNVAVSSILASVVEKLDLRCSRDRVLSDFQGALDNCGWECTVELCDVYEKLQFLKCSPCRTVDGDIRAVLNLGVILRSMGQKTGDLPGRGPLSERAEKFMCGWVAGLRHAGLHPLLETLQEKWKPTGQVFYNSDAIERLESGGVSNPRICPISLMRRYDCHVADLEALCTAIRVSSGTCGIHLPVTDAILGLDYGLTCTGLGVDGVSPEFVM